MKSNVEKISPLERKLHVEVPATMVQEAFDKAFRVIQKHASIKGFRKGKAPMATVKNLYADRVKQDVIEDIVQTHYKSALEQHSLSPINYPAIEFDPIEADRDFSFSAEFEIRPEVVVRQTENLPVKIEKYTLPSDFVSNTLEDIRKGKAELVPVLEDRPAQKGDVTVIDFEGSLIEGPLPGGSAQNHELELGSGSFIEGFEEGIEGMRVGESKTLSLSFPEKYHAADIAGKPVTFKVTLNTLKKKVLPELNDEFAKSLGTYENLAALKTAIEQDFEKREKKRINDDTKNRLARVLVENNPVDVPKSLLEEQKKALVEDFKQRMSQQGMSANDFEQYQDKWATDFEKTASFMIQSSFLMDKIAIDQGLRATTADIEAKIQEFAAQTGIDMDRVRAFYNEDDRRSRLSYQVTEDKVLDYLLSKAKVTEVSRDEIEKEMTA